MENPAQRWPGGRRAAVCLTYDDGNPCHTGFVAPHLESFGLRGTFYAPLQSDLMTHPLDWRALAARGHEIGNHTIFHPCRNTGGRYNSWLKEELYLERYTPEQWEAEIAASNAVLAQVDGRRERTFGNTCFDNWIGPDNEPVCLESLAAKHFIAARGEDTGRVVNLAELNLYNPGTVWADRRAFEDFHSELEEIQDTCGWVIYTFHGVGQGTHTHFIDDREHARLLEFLHAHQDTIWTAPLVEAVRYLKSL